MVLAAFIVLFFGFGGAGEFALDKTRRLAVAGLFLAGYASFIAMMFLTGKKRAGGLARDERDERIEGKAGGMTLTIVLFYVFFLGIALWAVFQDEGSVPAGWMWFLAYSTVFLGMISHGVLTLLLASGKVGDGEG